MKLKFKAKPDGSMLEGEYYTDYEEKEWKI